MYFWRVSLSLSISERNLRQNKKKSLNRSLGNVGVREVCPPFLEIRRNPKRLIHWIASPIFTENPFFFHWKVLRRIPFPKIGSDAFAPHQENGAHFWIRGHCSGKTTLRIFCGDHWHRNQSEAKQYDFRINYLQNYESESETEIRVKYLCGQKCERSSVQLIRKRKRKIIFREFISL